MLERSWNGGRLGARVGAQQVAAHARNLAQLELELAKLEMANKSRVAGVGIAFSAAGGVFAALALVFALAAATAAISLELPVWASILIMMGALVLIAGVSIAVGSRLLRRSALPMPEQAIKEAKLTAEALQRAT
jgi:Putative Actinobacterial Holin-X, holin superfamily III